jgi:hypothetical protein
MIIIEKLIKFNYIKFESGVEIAVSVIKKFIEESYEFEHTIGKGGNWTSDYIYFVRADEKELEPILLEMDVIRLSPNHVHINNNSGFKYKAYWLSDGYKDFVKSFEELIY